MPGLREIFFKNSLTRKENENILFSTFANLDDIVAKLLSKEGVCSEEIKALMDLCQKMKRDDLIQRLNIAYIEALDRELPNSCQKQLHINKPTYDA